MKPLSRIVKTCSTRWRKHKSHAWKILDTSKVYFMRMVTKFIFGRFPKIPGVGSQVKRFRSCISRGHRTIYSLQIKHNQIHKYNLWRLLVYIAALSRPLCRMALRAHKFHARKELSRFYPSSPSPSATAVRWPIAKERRISMHRRTKLISVQFPVSASRDPIGYHGWPGTIIR